MLLKAHEVINLKVMSFFLEVLITMVLIVSSNFELILVYLYEC